MSERALPRLPLARGQAGLRGFLAWWRAGLLAWLPARLRQVVTAGTEPLLLLPQADRVSLCQHQAGKLHMLAELPLPLATGGDPLLKILRERARQRPRWLLLPATMGLRRTLLLPAAARERLREVLAFEIERQTPFAMADVLYDGHIVQARDDGQIQAELVVVPKRQFAGLVARLGSLDDWLAGIDVTHADGSLLGVNLLPAAQRYRRRDPWRWWNLGLVLVLVLALVLAMMQLLDNRRAGADALQAGMAKREVAARALSAQRQWVIDAVQGAAFLQERRNARPPIVDTVSALSQRIPDGTYLERLSIDGNQLSVTGLSNQAAALVGQLEGTARLQAPALSGPLQQDPSLHMDRFTLVAQFSGAPGSPSVPAAQRKQEAR